MDWEEELIQIINDGCTDSDIEDFVEEHPDIKASEVFDFVAELSAPEQCKGCKRISMIGMGICLSCTRQPGLEDWYESR